MLGSGGLLYFDYQQFICLCFTGAQTRLEYIYNNKPLVLLLQEAPTYGDHYVVATGYHEFYYNGHTRMYQVNDGWGSTQANVNDNYVACITYLK